VTLSRELGVSRTPVREALQRLVQEGVVRVEPHRGFYVDSFKPGDIDEVYELRATLEGMALSLAASRLGRAELEEALADLQVVEAELSSACNQEEKQAADTHFLDLDRGFHRLIVERSGNRRLMQMVEGLWGQIAVFQWTGARKGWWDVAIDDHRRVIAALLEGDQERAEAALKRHIRRVKELVLADLAAGEHKGGELSVSSGPGQAV
jgi:DNA-binding GntR family transcriptional regulator